MTQSLLWVPKHHQKLFIHFTWCLYLENQSFRDIIMIHFDIYIPWLSNIFCTSFTVKLLLFPEITLLLSFFSYNVHSFLTCLENFYLPCKNYLKYDLFFKGVLVSLQLFLLYYLCTIAPCLYFQYGSSCIGSCGQEPVCQCRRLEFDPWVRKIPWRRAQQPTIIFLPGESQGQRNLVGYGP